MGVSRPINRSLESGVNGRRFADGTKRTGFRNSSHPYSIHPSQLGRVEMGMERGGDTN